MFITLRNLIVSIMAAFITDRDARHNFRNKYKRKTKFRKLRDDNKRMFEEIASIKAALAAHSHRFWEMEADRSFTFRVAPLDNSPPQGSDSEVFLCITCVAKNEAPYLREWIEYHKIVGVERFYFYDNESDDDTKEVLAPYIKDGTVVYHFLPNHPITKRRQQEEAYNDAIFKYRDRVRWMAFIDIDEFIVPVEKNSIPEFLADYDQYPGVAINWVCFDSNGHDRKPTAHGGLVTANYTRTKKDHSKIEGHNVGDDRIVKSIVDPKQVVNYISPHYGLFYHYFEEVTENFQRTRGNSTRTHSSNKIRINHYLTRSKEEYLNKIKRNHKGVQNIYEFNEATLNFQEETTEDLVIQKYVPQLKKAMGIKE